MSSSGKAVLFRYITNKGYEKTVLAADRTRSIPLHCFPHILSRTLAPIVHYLSRINRRMLSDVTVPRSTKGMAGKWARSNPYCDARHSYLLYTTYNNRSTKNLQSHERGRVNSLLGLLPKLNGWWGCRKTVTFYAQHALPATCCLSFLPFCAPWLRQMIAD